VRVSENSKPGLIQGIVKNLEALSGVSSLDVYLPAWRQEKNLGNRR